MDERGEFVDWLHADEDQRSEVAANTTMLHAADALPPAAIDAYADDIAACMAAVSNRFKHTAGDARWRVWLAAAKLAAAAAAAAATQDGGGGADVLYNVAFGGFTMPTTLMDALVARTGVPRAFWSSDEYHLDCVLNVRTHPVAVALVRERRAQGRAPCFQGTCIAIAHVPTRALLRHVEVEDYYDGKESVRIDAGARMCVDSAAREAVRAWRSAMEAPSDTAAAVVAAVAGMRAIERAMETRDAAVVTHDDTGACTRVPHHFG